MASRQRFCVDLTEGETTVVSWKKLVSSAKRELELGMPAPNVLANSGGSTFEAPAAAAAPVVDPAQPVPNRLTAVIEKIEHLFQGEDGDEENGNGDDAPAEEWYDTDDSFIDDEELDNYFVKDKVKTKYSGFFINRGALEKISEQLSPIEVTVQPLARKKRAESKKSKAATSASLEVVVPKSRKRKAEPGMPRKKREPNAGSKKYRTVQNLVQGPCPNLGIVEVVEPKKRKSKVPVTGMLKKGKRSKTNPVQEPQVQEPCQNLEIEDKS